MPSLHTCFPAQPSPLLPGSLDRGSSIPQLPPLPRGAGVRLRAPRLLLPPASPQPPTRSEPPAPAPAASEVLLGRRGGGGRKGFIGKKKKKRSGVMQGCALEGAARSAGVREGWVGGWAGSGTFPYLLRYPSPCAAAAAALRQPPACRRGADL